jgi:fluoroacetyl-CoA thioesterase
MKPGIRIGQTYEYEVTVTEEMRAQFDGKTVHELYSTAAMLNHMEWASRQHILPLLEHDEEGMGYHMEIDHIRPTPIGAKVRITSRVTGLLPDKVICQCEAHHGDRDIGKALVVQAILPLSKLRDRIP